jgi:hypothetical protein
MAHGTLFVGEIRDPFGYITRAAHTKALAEAVLFEWSGKGEPVG